MGDFLEIAKLAKENVPDLISLYIVWWGTTKLEKVLGDICAALQALTKERIECQLRQRQ